MRGVHHSLHGHECPPMMPPTPRHSNKLIRLLVLPRPIATLSLDKSHCFVPWALLPQACKPHPIATLHPKRKVCAIGVCRGGTYATSATIRPLVGGVVLRTSDAKRTEKTGCVSRGILRLYARWRSPRQETTLRRSDNMLSLNQVWSSSLRVGRLSNDVPLPRTKSWRWSHRPRPPPPPHHSAAIATKKSPSICMAVRTWPCDWPMGCVPRAWSTANCKMKVCYEHGHCRSQIAMPTHKPEVYCIRRY